MSAARAGWLIAAALTLGTAAAADRLVVEAEDGRRLIQAELPGGAEWCLRWNHSVTGGAAADCFRGVGGRMVLSRSYLHDFAAGLGTLPGRGTLRSAAGGGYWIEGIDETLPPEGLVLRVGRPEVDHRITLGGQVLPLSTQAAGARVRLRVERGG